MKQKLKQLLAKALVLTAKAPLGLAKAFTKLADKIVAAAAKLANEQHHHSSNHIVDNHVMATHDYH